MPALIICLIAIFAGPIISFFFQKKPGFYAFLDGFNLVAILILVISILLPEFFVNSDWLLIFFLAAGIFLPGWLEHQFLKFHKQIHNFALLLAVIGIEFHAMFDGAAMSPLLNDSSNLLNQLSISVILHQIPVSLAIWGVLSQSSKKSVGLFFLASMAFFTALGFFLGSSLSEAHEDPALQYFQMFVLGSLFHVVFHRSSQGHFLKSNRHSLFTFEGIGAIVALVGLALMIYFQWIDIQAEYWQKIIPSFLDLFSQSAPALILGFFLAGFITIFTPSSITNFLQRGGPWRQAFKGVVVGLPLPVCSCGVVPLYRSLIEKKIPATAGMAFLIATPELGLDAIFLSLPLLGGPFTLLRVFTAFIVALLIGVIVGKLAHNAGKAEIKKRALFKARPASENRNLMLRPNRPTLLTDKPAPSTTLEKVRQSLRYSFMESIDHNGPWIFIGLMIAALINPLLPGSNSSLFSLLTNSYAAIPILTLIGIPLYICASGATPLAAVLLFHAVSPGAVIALLISGPATNVTTFGILRKLHGNKIALLFGLTMIGLTMAVGFLVDGILPRTMIINQSFQLEHSSSWLELASMIAISGLFLFSLLRRGPRNMLAELKAPGTNNNPHAGHQH